MRLLLSFFLISIICLKVQSKNIIGRDELQYLINKQDDTLRIFNFWATWCKPCVAELPEFEKLDQESKANKQKVKVLLVSMDFVEELNKKVKDFLEKNKYTCEVVLLDEVNGNDFINKISEKWSGAVPATLVTMKNKKRIEFHEGKLTLEMLQKMIFEK